MNEAIKGLRKASLLGIRESILEHPSSIFHAVTMKFRSGLTANQSFWVRSACPISIRQAMLSIHSTTIVMTIQPRSGFPTEFIFEPQQGQSTLSCLGLVPANQMQNYCSHMLVVLFLNIILVFAIHKVAGCTRTTPPTASQARRNNQSWYRIHRDSIYKVYLRRKAGKAERSRNLSEAVPLVQETYRCSLEVQELSNLHIYSIPSNHRVEIRTFCPYRILGCILKMSPSLRLREK